MGTGVCPARQTSDPKQPPAAQTPSGADAKSPPPSKGAVQSPPAANKFPYPGETEATPAPSTEKTQPGTGALPAGSAAGKSFPYPGDPAAGDAGSSSSSSSTSAAPAGTGDIPAEAETPHRRKLPREFHPQSPEDRVTEDLEVAKFYRDKGDLHAAYLRAQDATKVIPSDPEAHFLLGQIAQQMKRHDEAVAEFKSYLQLEPDGDHVKEARRRLADMR